MTSIPPTSPRGLKRAFVASTSNKVSKRRKVNKAPSETASLAAISLRSGYTEDEFIPRYTNALKKKGHTGIQALEGAQNTVITRRTRAFEQKLREKYNCPSPEKDTQSISSSENVKIEGAEGSISTVSTGTWHLLQSISSGSRGTPSIHSSDGSNAENAVNTFIPILEANLKPRSKSLHEKVLGVRDEAKRVKKLSRQINDRYKRGLRQHRDLAARIEPENLKEEALAAYEEAKKSRTELWVEAQQSKQAKKTTKGQRRDHLKSRMTSDPETMQKIKAEYSLTSDEVIFAKNLMDFCKGSHVTVDSCSRELVNQALQSSYGITSVAPVRAQEIRRNLQQFRKNFKNEKNLQVSRAPSPLIPIAQAAPKANPFANQE